MCFVCIVLQILTGKIVASKYSCIYLQHQPCENHKNVLESTLGSPPSDYNHTKLLSNSITLHY